MSNDKLANILLVEDDEVDILNIKRAFKKNQINNPLFIARNGIEALDLLRGRSGSAAINPPPRVIILDINMPKMNGLEFLKAIREDKELRGLPVFVMTTSNEESDVLEAYRLNVAGYVLKQMSFDDFNQSISVLKDFWSLCVPPGH